MDIREIPEKEGIAGEWFVYEMVADPSIENAEEIINAHYQRYRNGLEPRKFPEWSRANMIAYRNTVCDGLINTIIKRMTGENTGGEDLLARKVAIGTGNLATNQTQTQLQLELARFDFTDAYQDSNRAVYATTVGRTQGNGYSSEVVAYGSASTTVFAVTPGTAGNFSVGDRIRVASPTFEFITITAIDTVNDRITVASGLSATPTVGTVVLKSWAEAGIFGNTGASGTANSGTIFNRVNGLDYGKDNTKIILIEVTFTFTPI